MKVTLSLFAAAGLLAPLNSSALTFNLTGDWLASEYANQGIPGGSLIMLVASTEDKKFDSPNGSGLTPQGSDDVVLGTFTAINGTSVLNKGSFIASVHVNLNDAAAGLEHLDGGDPLILRWFPTLTEKDAFDARLLGRIPYGEFRTDGSADDSTDAWVTPSSNAATISLHVAALVKGSAYNPHGSILAKELAAVYAITATAIIESNYATVTISSIANGVFNLSWPLLESGLGQVQQSIDLQHWENLSMGDAQVGQSTATLNTVITGQKIFFRIESE